MKKKLRTKIFTIVCIVLIAIALIGIGIGYIMIGADVLAWFTSRWAIWIYVFVGMFLAVWGCIELWEWTKKL